MDASTQRDDIPPHRGFELPGVHAYTSQKSIAAGDDIGFHVSSDVPCTLTICKPTRIGDRSADQVIHEFPPSDAWPQAIHPGSYLVAERGLGRHALMRGASFEVWVKPWSFGREQTILGQFDFPAACGYRLYLGAEGSVRFYVGSGADFIEHQVLVANALELQHWHHLVATWDGSIAALWINGRKSAERALSATLLPGSAPIRLGSSGNAGLADHFLDGDLMSPAIYSRPLTEEDIGRRHENRARHVPLDRSVLACWPMREQVGDTAEDSSGNGHTARVVNHATWMINGPAFDPAIVPIHQESQPPYDPRVDPQRGSGIRLARDDLYDCRWEVTHTYRVPATSRPGIYVGRIEYTVGGVKQVYDITFIVTKAIGAKAAPMLVLCSTATWLAYSVSPFGGNSVAPQTYPRRGAALPNSHPEAPAYSTYTRHRGGQPTYHIGLRMPWPNASPDALYDPKGTGFAQWCRLELHLHFWLDLEGYEYDVLSDFDLHRNPDALADYRTVVINGHSEYWSIPAYDGVDRYLKHGGTAVVLSGNTMCSRVSFDDAMQVMEERKTTVEAVFAPGAPYPGGAHGEQYHSNDGLRGGPLRHTDRAGAHLVGLDTAGWAFAEAKDFGVYEARLPAHFLFNVPTRLGIAAGQKFGQAGGGALPRAIGHEWDLTFKTLKQMTSNTPEGCALPADHQNIEIIATGMRRTPGSMDAYLDYFLQPCASLDGLSCEMIYWERPEGGRVFNAGAVGASWVLGSDPLFEGLLSNVFHHFGISRPTLAHQTSP